MTSMEMAEWIGELRRELQALRLRVDVLDDRVESLLGDRNEQS
jgi:hypothetical protein